MKTRSSLLLSASLVLVAATAGAHVSTATPYGYAGTTQEITFQIAHGCSGADTYALRLQIPNGVTSVRPMRSDFGKATVEKNASNDVTAITWQKADADALDADTSFYKLVVRMKLPATAFTTHYFVAKQTCRAANGALSTVDWSAIPVNGDAGAEEPAASLVMVPAHVAGWNKMTVTAAVKDLSIYFKDALIVWKGNAAWSANPATTEQIKQEAGVTPLTDLATGDEIWVRY